MNLKKLIEKIKNKIDNSLIDIDQYVLFICSQEALPSPLPADDEHYYLTLLGTEQHDFAKKKLIEHNLRLVVFVSKKFLSTKVEFDDLVSIGIVGLIKAVKSYNLEKNIKLATYASRCIENEILMHLRKIQKSKNNISLEDQISVDSSGNVFTLGDTISDDGETANDTIERQSDKSYLHSLVDALPPKERKIIQLRFAISCDREYTQKEVADMMNMSQSYISRLEKKILKNMQKTINNDYY